ncbi:MAG: DEAD/DEAH box helicase [Chloroflexota bacterium]|nr:DEAD/DEAH box helicase [Dehalococcoidia bacterium]MDW8253653.1 DEAD/DEAH box helicase [Chloroflexota bacterium]
MSDESPRQSRRRVGSEAGARSSAVAASDWRPSAFRPTPVARQRAAQFAARYPFELDPFQRDAIAALADGHSLLVTAPTGTGKTVIAEFAVQDALDAGQRLIYTTPLRALSAQKFRDFVAIWGAERVGMVTGETAINDRAPILVMTTEILRNRLVSEGGDEVRDLRAVVLDEFHYLADLDRGRVWEEVVLLIPPSVQLVCLSATLPNVAEVADWLHEVHGSTVVVTHDQRAVPLDVYYFDGSKLLRVADPSGKIVARPRGRTRDPENPDLLAAEVVAHLAQRQFLPAIVFVMSRRRTEEQCDLTVDSGLDLLLDPTARDDIEREIRAVEERIGSEELAMAQLDRLAAALPRGVAFHHAGLVPALRELVERLFESGRIGVVFATGTLALGINMPARTVVLEQLSTRDERGWRPLHKREFLQMAGRAGRRGKDRLGHVVVLKHPFDLFDHLERLLKLPPEPITSAFQLDYASALYLLDRYGAEGMVEMYRRSFATFQKLRAAEAIARGGKRSRSGEPLFLVRRRAQIENDIIDHARRLESILGRYGYWDGRRVTLRAAFLRRFFHGNALLTSELVIGGALKGLLATELAEVASWLEGGGRTGRGRRPPSLPPRLAHLYRVIWLKSRVIERHEQENLLAVSAGLGPPALHGLVWRAVRGESLAKLCEDYAVDPGDVYGRLTDTAMWLRQLESALLASGLDPALADVARTARHLLVERAGSVGFTPLIPSIAAIAEPPEPALDIPEPDSPIDRPPEEDHRYGRPITSER